MPDVENAAPVQDNWNPALFEQVDFTQKEDVRKKQKEEEEYVSLYDNGYEDEEEEKTSMEQESNSNQYVVLPFDSEDKAWDTIFQNMSQETVQEMSDKGAWVNYAQDNYDFVADVDGDGIPGATVGLTPEEQEQASKIVPFEQQYLLDNLPEGKYVTEKDIQKIHSDYKAIKNDKSLDDDPKKRESYADATRKAALDDLIKNAPTYDAIALQKEQFAKGNDASSYKVYRKSDSNKLVETTIGSRTLNEALKQKMEKNQRTIGKIEHGKDQSKHTIKNSAQQFLSGEAEQMSKSTLVMTASAALLLIGFLRKKGLEKANEVLKEDAAKGIQLKDGMTLEQAIKEVMDDLKNHPDLFGKTGPDTEKENLEDDSLLEEENKEEPEEISNFLEENDKGEEGSKEESNDELENPDVEKEISSEEEKDIFEELADDLNDSTVPTQETDNIENPELEEAIDGMDLG